MYYLQSRYYNPEWGRFINADAIIGEVGELLSHNMFAYCQNNTVNNYDPTGFKDEQNGGGGGILELALVVEQMAEKNVQRGRPFLTRCINAIKYNIKNPNILKRGRNYVKLSPSELNSTHKITMSRNQFNSFVKAIKDQGIKETIKYVEYNGRKYVVDGNHRLRAAKQLGIKEVPAQKVELPYQGYKTFEDLLWE